MTVRKIPSGITMIDILQLYHIEGTSGTLKVTDKEHNEHGWITLEEGEIINCRFGVKENQAALVELCGRSALAFEYLKKLLFPEPGIHKRFMHLMLEVTIQRDESLLV